MVRRTLHVLTALLLAVALGATLVAGQAAAKPSATKRGATATKKSPPRPKRATQMTVATSAGKVKVSTTVVMQEVDAGPTGDGPADEEVCDGFAGNIFAQLLNLQAAMKEGDGDRAVALAEAVENLTDMALDAGCFVIY